jgi:hypothetical protein
MLLGLLLPITVPSRPKAWTVFVPRTLDHSFESHCRHGCPCALILCLCVGSDLETDWSTVQGVLPTEFRSRNWKRGQVSQGISSHCVIVYNNWAASFLLASYLVYSPKMEVIPSPKRQWCSTKLEGVSAHSIGRKHSNDTNSAAKLKYQNMTMKSRLNF